MRKLLNITVYLAIIISNIIGLYLYESGVETFAFIVIVELFLYTLGYWIGRIQ